jgi:hypothetical protein
LLSIQKRVECRAALVNLDQGNASILRECFRQFRIQTVDLSVPDGRIFDQEKYDAAVLRLQPGCESLLAAVRQSPRNRHLMLYGIYTPGEDLRRFSSYAINVMMNDPLDKQGALKTVRSTHLLVLHEFRRYVRVPMITEVKIDYEHDHFTGNSIEISGGGMSLRAQLPAKLGSTTEIFFSLPGTKSLSCNAIVSWIDSAEGILGLRFDPEDKRRAEIKNWIEDYLED